MLNRLWAFWCNGATKYLRLNTDVRKYSVYSAFALKDEGVKP